MRALFISMRLWGAPASSPVFPVLGTSVGPPSIPICVSSGGAPCSAACILSLEENSSSSSHSRMHCHKGQAFQWAPACRETINTTGCSAAKLGKGGPFVAVKEGPYGGPRGPLKFYGKTEVRCREAPAARRLEQQHTRCLEGRPKRFPSGAPSCLRWGPLDAEAAICGGPCFFYASPCSRLPIKQVSG